MSKNINKYTKLGLETKIENIEKHVASINEKLGLIDKTLEKNTMSLIEHMRRTDTLEQLIQSIQDKDLKTLNRHVAMVEGVIKFFGVVALFVGLASGIISLINSI